MKKQKFLTKITSGLLAVLMILPIFTTWKVEAATAEEHTVNSSTVQNEHLKIISNGEKHVLYTTGGNPDSTTDNNKKLLYDCTSRTLVKIGSNIWWFSPSSTKATADGTSLYSVASHDGIKIERFMSFAYNTYTSRYDTVEYKYVLTNTSADTKSVGTRIMFDTMLGNNDSAPFKVNGQEVTTGRTYTGDDVPQTWNVFDSFVNPTVVASGTFWRDASEKPDKVQFINWGTANNDIWDCTASGTIGDSAVNVYFNPIDLAPGESRTVKTYYGISEFEPDPIIPDPPTPDPDADVRLTAVMAPNELLPTADGLAYQGNPFSYTGWINNVGSATATNVVATINLPAGLSTDTPVINIGDLAAGANYGLVWNITANLMAVDTTLEYSVTITADDEDPITASYSVYLPAVVHTHDYVETSRTEATCTIPGYIYYECSCGFETYSYCPALGHRYQSMVVVEANCTTPGIIRHICTRCSEYYDTFVYAEHRYSEVEFVAATCTTDGYHKYQCDTCSDYYIIDIPGGHSYEANIISLPTATENGEAEYICSICNDRYVEILPMRPDANILLVQDRLPWTENINTALLDRLVAQGYATGWDITTTTDFPSVNLASYSIIYIANDQTTATYDRLYAFNEAITNFASAGGVVVYGACDHGWAGGNISYSLPGGVTKGNYYSYRNYIVNNTHDIVTGVLTDGKALTDSLLYSTYSSHTYFTNLPADATVILSDANGRPTLVEYPLGDGYIIASGLTWEYTYVRDFVNGTSFAKSVYDDMLVHALMLSEPCDHIFDEGVEYPATCKDEGYTLVTCTQCGATFRVDIVSPTGEHTPGGWFVATEPTLTSCGLKVKICTVCEEILETEVLPPLGTAYVAVESASNTVILGQTIEFYVVAYGLDPVDAIALNPMFDTDVFELVSVEWLKEADLQSIEDGTLRSVSAWENPTDINGAVYKIILRAHSLTNATPVIVTAMIQDSAGMNSVPMLPMIVSVISCPHVNYTLQPADADRHVAICDVCGYNELRAHSFDHGCDTDCNDGCGYTRITEHVPGTEWYSDGTNHWHICTVCDADVELTAHNPTTEWINDGTNHWHLCADCGTVLDLAAHTEGTAWVTDDDNHWHTCNECEFVLILDVHVYDGDLDAFCNVCEYRRILIGDLEDDLDVDSNDAIYLLLNVMHGDALYPLNQPCDFDNDGDVDSDDACYLLYHSFFGSSDYPLVH